MARAALLVAYAAMTGNAIHARCVATHCRHGRCHFLMALGTRVACNAIVELIDLDVVREMAGGEGQGMEETVARLGVVLRNEASRAMAVVADGNVGMAALHPSRMFIAHDMAVHARIGIVGEIRRTFGVTESEDANAS